MPRWQVTFDLHIDLLSPELVRLVSEASALARVIRGIPIPPHLRRRLDGLNILRAVRGTTGIEGSDLSEDEVQAVLASEGATRVLARPREREEQEVRNAAAVMHFISAHLASDPTAEMTEGLICTIHEMTTASIAYEHNIPGVYRSHAVRAGTYVPPDNRDEVLQLMREFIRWLNGKEARSWPAPVRALAAHFYFISIHPFGDGNGRTARAIESFLLYQANLNALGFYSLSNFYYRNRSEYIAALDMTRFDSDRNLTPFVLFGLRGLVQELEAVHGEVLDAVAEISFRDMANELLLHDHKLERKVRERLYTVVVGCLKPVNVADLRAGRHPLSGLYAQLSAKTLSRDLALLKRKRLLIQTGDSLKANLQLMREFMP